MSLGDRVDSEVRAQAKNQANLVAVTAPELLESGQSRTLQRLVDSSAESQRGRALVVDATGRVVADSAGRGELGANYASRPEIAAALRGQTVQQTRRSQTLNEQILATAVPVRHGARIDGAVRVTQSVAAVDRATREAIVEPDAARRAGPRTGGDRRRVDRAGDLTPHSPAGGGRTPGRGG